MLTVVLGRTTPVYRPRELLTGDIVFKTPAVCRILDLKVNFRGESRVSFLVASGEGRARVREKVEEIETHLDVLHPLIKNYRGVVVEEGVHTYQFCLKLPTLLPSSYTSQYGHIDYYIDVYLQTSKVFCTVRKPFVIKAPVNILLFPVSQSPQSGQVCRRYGLVSYKTFRLKASVMKTCLEPGDIVSVFIETRNETRRELKYLFCTLKKITTVLVHGAGWGVVERVTKDNLQTEAHEAAAGRYYSWHCQLPTPTQLTPTVAASTIIFVTYSIQVSAKLKRVTIPPEVEVPIVFSTRTPIPSQRSRIHSNSESSSANVSSSNDSCVQSSSRGGCGPRRRVTVCSRPAGLLACGGGGGSSRNGAQVQLAKSNTLI